MRSSGACMVSLAKSATNLNSRVCNPNSIEDHVEVVGHQAVSRLSVHLLSERHVDHVERKVLTH